MIYALRTAETGNIEIRNTLLPFHWLQSHSCCTRQPMFCGIFIIVSRAILIVNKNLPLSMNSKSYRLVILFKLATRYIWVHSLSRCLVSSAYCIFAFKPLKIAYANHAACRSLYKGKINFQIDTKGQVCWPVSVRTFPVPLDSDNRDRRCTSFIRYWCMAERCLDRQRRVFVCYTFSFEEWCSGYITVALLDVVDPYLL